MAQKLILAGQMAKLLANGRITAKTHDGSDIMPVVKFFMPTGAATWLISEIDEDGDRMFGLCDLGVGEPELGYVSLAELKTIKGRFGLGVERDMHFTADRSIEKYAALARVEGRIIA